MPKFKKENKSELIHVSITKEWKNWLTLKALREGVTIATVIRWAIKDYMEDPKP